MRKLEQFAAQPDLRFREDGDPGGIGQRVQDPLHGDVFEAG